MEFAATAAPEPEPAPLRVDWLVRWLGLGGLVLIAATWRLWTPQEVFPRVPLLDWTSPRWLDWLALVVVLAGCLGLVMHRGLTVRRGAAALAMGGWAMLFLADQHRLQPWAWQFFLLALVIALADQRTIFFGWRWLVISIYIYSAISKLDWAFVEEMGPVMLEPWRQLAPAGRRIPTPGAKDLWATLQIGLPWLLPLGELLVAGLLATRRGRHYGLASSWVMHLSLLGLLGPLGLNHSPGVLLWNAFFLIQNWLLFCPSGRPTNELPSAPERPPRTRSLAWGVLAVAYVWPAGVPLGWCDPWLGWVVYAPPFEQVTIWIDESTVAKLPPPLRESCRSAGLVDDRVWTWHEVQVDPNQWSLKTLGVPSYPSSRFRTGVALALLEQQLVPQLDLVVFTRRDRTAVALLPGDPLRTRDQIETHAGHFWFNAFPEALVRR